jgi:hypothetical protein
MFAPAVGGEPSLRSGAEGANAWRPSDAAAALAQAHALGQGGFVERADNVLCFGLPGTGKSHVASAIGHALVQTGRSVLFVPTYQLVQELLVAKRNLGLCFTYMHAASLRRISLSQVTAYLARAGWNRREHHHPKKLVFKGSFDDRGVPRIITMPDELDEAGLTGCLRKLLVLLWSIEERPEDAIVQEMAEMVSPQGIVYPWKRFWAPRGSDVFPDPHGYLLDPEGQAGQFLKANVSQGGRRPSQGGRRSGPQNERLSRM